MAVRTQGDLITDVRSRLDEPTEFQWTDVEIRRWINQGAREVARRTETLQDTRTQALTSGLQQYTAPNDAIRIYRVEYIEGSTVRALEYRDYNNMDSVWWSSQLTIQGSPLLWTAWGFPPNLKAVLYPIPSNSSASIKFYYYRHPISLAESTNADANTALDFPEGWEDIITDYVEYMALRKDRDPRWQECYKMFNDHVEQMYEQTRRWSDQAGMIDVGTGVPLHPYIWNEDWS